VPPRTTRPRATADRAARILDLLEQAHPEARCALDYRNAFELAVATILSAQCTDERVNKVTPRLFERYRDAGALARAPLAEVEEIIRSTGFFRAKARSITGFAKGLVERHGGEVPRSMAALVPLPGIGRKTANVVLGHALGVPGLPVDRHVLRVTNRIGLAASDDPEVVEQQLGECLPRESWTGASDTFILHGRRVCKPKPLCDRCVVRDACDFFQKGAEQAGAGPAPRRKAAARRPASKPRTSRT
jgi:endonuclease III